jgi:hypothetical protein
MKCPNCGKETSLIKTKYINGELMHRCHICGDFSELSKIKYESPLASQKRQWQREKHAKDIMQPWEVKETRKGWIPNKDFIKAYKNDPDKLSMFSEQELKNSGEVTEKQSRLSRKGKFKDAKRIGGDPPRNPV